MQAVGDLIHSRTIRHASTEGALYATHQAERTGNPLDSFWNRLPPPLLREGNKAQTPWLTSFLKDPHMIRPAKRGWRR